MRFLFDISRFHLAQIIVFGSFLCGIFYFTLYDKGDGLKTSMQGIKTNIEDTEKQVKKEQKALEDIKAFEKETLAQEEDIRYFLNFIPSSLTFTEVSTLLINEAKAAGINIEVKQDRQSRQNVDSEYQTLDIQLTVKGSFSQILLFLSKLTNQRRILVVNNINMRVDKDQLIGASLDISAYRYNEKKDEAEGGAK